MPTSPSSPVHPDAPPSFSLRPSLEVRPRPWRPIVLWVLGLGALACLALGWSWGQSVRAVYASYDAALAELETRIEAVPLLSTDELARLRRSRNDRHLERARQLGVAPIATRAGLDSARAVGDSLAVAETGDRYVVWDGDHSDPLLTPSAIASLDSIATRFEAALDAARLPRYRFTVSSVLRSSQDQAELRGVNGNAAAGRSSHEYGTTYDITYRRYSPQPVTAPPSVPGKVPRMFLPAVRDALARRRAAAYRQLAEDYPARLDAILGRALIELEDEGVLVTVRERRQPVYHTTVARELAPAVVSSDEGGPAAP